jgi:hypothetical protein
VTQARNNMGYSELELKSSDGIAAARTRIVLEGNAAALPALAPLGADPYAGDDLRNLAVHFTRPKTAPPRPS